jgi:hypothetical protein
MQYHIIKSIRHAQDVPFRPAQDASKHTPNMQYHIIKSIRHAQDVPFRPAQDAPFLFSAWLHSDCHPTGRYRKPLAFFTVLALGTMMLAGIL